MNPDDVSRLDEAFKRLRDVIKRNGIIMASLTNTSPTSPESKGMYPYQEPERDENGVFYGYKVLHRHCPNCYFFVSPRYHAVWENGYVEANVEPREDTLYGIHCVKRADNDVLRPYFIPFDMPAGEPFLVKLALSGTIIETEQGFRAQFAQVVEVYYHGNWQTYPYSPECPAPGPTRQDYPEDYISGPTFTFRP